MLVRLAPGTDYPGHRHAEVEELHLLYGELMIDDKKFHPGDYIRAEADSVDHRVWSETGCTCVLLTATSAADAAYDDRGCGSARHVTFEQARLASGGVHDRNALSGARELRNA